MLVSDLITSVRVDYLDDTLGVDSNDPLVTNASLIRFANQAQVQACRRDQLIFDDETASVCEITLVEDQRAYDYSELITRLYTVRHDGVDLTKINEEMLDNYYSGWRDADSATPTHYYIKGKKLYLYPEPDATAAAIKLNLTVHRMPLAELDEVTDELELFDEATEDLVYWMLYRTYNLRDEDLFDPDAAALYLGLFTQTYGPAIPLDVRIHQLESVDSLVHTTPDRYKFTNKSRLQDADFDSSGWS